MHRSVLLMLVSTLLLSVAVGLPLSLEESAEESWLEQLLKDNWETEEQLDLDDSHGNSIHKRAAKASSSSSEEHKDKAKDKADSSSSEEHRSTTVPAGDEESTTQAAARRRREALSDFSADFRRACLEEPSGSAEISGVDPRIRNEFLKIMCQKLGYFLQLKKDINLDFEEIADEDDRYTGNAIRPRAVRVGEAFVRHRARRQVSGQKASEEQELDAQAEKELDEEMARAVADVKDNGSIEDYAQGCEVMEVSSKEANEATYAE